MINLQAMKKYASATLCYVIQALLKEKNWHSGYVSIRATLEGQRLQLHQARKRSLHQMLP
jgi:hypothetical protein